jgi:hypothetical protein
LLLDADQGPAEQVAVVKVSQIELLGSLLHLKKGGNDLYVHTEFLGGIDGLEHAFLLDVGDGDDQHLCTNMNQRLSQIVDGAPYLDAQKIGAFQ